MSRIKIIIRFKTGKMDFLDTDIQCMHGAINRMTIEIDANVYTDYKFSRKNRNIYPHSLDSKEFVSTLIPSNLVENIDKIELEMIIS